MLPSQPAQYLIAGEIEDPDALLAALKQYLLGLDADYTLVTPDLVRLLHDHGIEVNVWTVNTPEEAEKLIGMGVDYITSNILE